METIRSKLITFFLGQFDKTENDPGYDKDSLFENIEDDYVAFMLVETERANMRPGSGKQDIPCMMYRFFATVPITDSMGQTRFREYAVGIVDAPGMCIGVGTMVKIGIEEMSNIRDITAL